MSNLQFPIKKISFPLNWAIVKNSFVDLEPDNNLKIEDVWFFFQEDLLQVSYNDHIIDLGFYGEYLSNRDGFFKVVLIKGDFLTGKTISEFSSRSTDEIVNEVNKFIEYLS